MIDVTDFELHNLQVDSGRLRVRDAFRSQTTATAIRSGSEFVGGFTLKSPNTTEAFHYLFVRDETTADGYCYVTTEEFRNIATKFIGSIPRRPVITYAVQDQQLLINSPHFTHAFYGIAGGGLINATKVDSVNQNVTTLDVPPGLCCTFGDRVAIAQYSQLYFSDGGAVDLRTFVDANAVDVPGQGSIYDLFQGPGGGLYAVTSDGIYVLPADAQGQGQAVFGMLSKISGYSASNYRNSCTVRNGIFGLVKEGIASISDAINSFPLTSYDRKRYYSEYVGPGSASDYRNGTIWPLSDGLLINVDGRLAKFDLVETSASWLYNSNDIEVVGVLQTRDGADLILTPDYLLEQIGNVEYDGYEIDGIACGTIPSDPERSLVIRSVTTSANNVGQDQLVYLGGTAKSAVTPPPARANNVIGTDTWSATERYYVEEDRSRRHQMAVRTDEISLEVGATGSGNAVGVIGFQAIPSNRPTN